MSRFLQEKPREEINLIQKATKDLENVNLLLDKLRCLCLQRGIDGILQFGAMFRRMDKDRNGVLSREEFYLGLHETGLKLNENEKEEICLLFDRDQSGTISYEELIQSIRPPINANRMKMIKMAFNKMDKNQDGKINIDDLKMFYNVKSHQLYMRDQASDDEILKLYLKNFEKNGSVDAIITSEEFIDYYSGISASIDNDCYFDLMMRQTWKL